MDGTGEEIRYSYDALNRMVKQEAEEGSCVYEYDSAGNLRLFTDENGNTTAYEYSPNGNLNKVTDALGNETCYGYDCMGNLTEIEQIGETPHFTAEKEKAGKYGKQITRYERDLEGRITKIKDPAGCTEYYVYDKNGRITKKRDKDNFCTIFHYGRTGDLTEISYGDGRSLMFSYDALHHLEEIKDWDGTTKIITDALGRVLSVTEPDGRAVSYEWGAANEKRALAYPDGRKAEYSYNNRGLLEQLTIGRGTVKYSYDEKGRLTKKELPNGVVTSYAYNRRGRIGQIRHEGAEFSESYKYAYDAVGNKILAEKKRKGIEDEGSFAYQYDALNRLIQVKKDGERLREYEYDPFGNRTVKREYADGIEKVIRYSYNEKNQLLSETDSEIEKRYQYDLRGNMTEMAIGGKQVKQFIFDAANRMSSSAELTGDVIRKAEYRYNGLGQRVGQNIWRTDWKSTDIVRGLIDVPTPEMPEEKISYTLDATRTYYNTLCLEAGDKRQDFYWDDNVAVMEEGGAESYYIHDDLGSPARLLDGRGNSREVYGYDEFGVDLCRKLGQPHQQIQPFGFTGYQMEEAGGVYFAQVRRYDAELGRFISEDFIKGLTVAPYTLNHYGYCWNRPLDLVDINGLWAEGAETAAKIVTAAVAVVAVAAVVAVVATGGAVVAPAIAAGAAVAGVVSGIANEKVGGSYINGWVGGAVSGGLQTAFGIKDPRMYIIAGSVNGVGSAITDVLDNIDPTNDKYKTTEEICKDACTNAVKGMVYSIPGAYMGWTVNSAKSNLGTVQGLMPTYSIGFGEGLSQFFGVLDNLLLVEESLNGGNKKNKETKE